MQYKFGNFIQFFITNLNRIILIHSEYRCVHGLHNLFLDVKELLLVSIVRVSNHEEFKPLGLAWSKQSLKKQFDFAGQDSPYLFFDHVEHFFTEVFVVMGQHEGYDLINFVANHMLQYSVLHQFLFVQNVFLLLQTHTLFIVIIIFLVVRFLHINYISISLLLGMTWVLTHFHWWCSLHMLRRYNVLWFLFIH